MFADLLDLPARTRKPRRTGLTMVIDGGLPPRALEDQLSAAAEHVDLVKFGWGTAVVTPSIERKIGIVRDLGIEFYFGGTLFEKFALQDRLDSYLALCGRVGATTIEVSNGTVPITNTAKAAYIRKCARDFRVISEVGYKDSDRSLHFAPSQWIDAIAEDLEAGAALVITEARESGRSGICRPDGELRFGLIEDILGSGIDADRLVFEAPNKDLQTYFVTRVGANVNLGNVEPGEVIGLETLRLGLRADTLMHFEERRTEQADA